jgi:hypothetical protein
MAELPINANISELGGALYEVRLQWVPRVGELIDLYSFVDTVAHQPPAHRYEVVQVIHRLHDVTDKTDLGRDGHHFVRILVKRSTSHLFDK